MIVSAPVTPVEHHEISRILVAILRRFHARVGGTRFVINLILLTIFHRVLEWPIFLSQALAAEIALFSNFMLHHHWTYKAHKVNKSMSNLIVQFHVTSWPAILGSSIMVSTAEKTLHLNNLANTAYMQWDNYPTQRFNFMLGARLTF